MESGRKGEGKQQETEVKEEGERLVKEEGRKRRREVR